MENENSNTIIYFTNQLNLTLDLIYNNILYIYIIAVTSHIFKCLVQNN